MSMLLSCALQEAIIAPLRTFHFTRGLLETETASKSPAVFAAAWNLSMFVILLLLVNSKMYGNQLNLLIRQGIAKLVWIRPVLEHPLSLKFKGFIQFPGRISTSQSLVLFYIIYCAGYAPTANTAR